MQNHSRRAAARLLKSLALTIAACAPVSLHAADCPQPAQWLRLDNGHATPVALQDVIAHAARQRVVLLGESHDSAEHHRWQLHVLAALHARQPAIALGLEMFPRRLQPVLDAWSAGTLGESEFLQRSEWDEVWGIDPALYLPLFHYARMHRIPMLALNVERTMVREIGSQGWEAIPAERREGVADPAPPSNEYLKSLYDAFVAHGRPGTPSAQPPAEADLRDPQFTRFVQSMQVWDRAMAQRISDQLVHGSTRMVIGIMGSGHLRDGFGVPHQLRALGVHDAVVLLPWETGTQCETPQAGVADYLFGVMDDSAPAPRPRLGVTLDNDEAGVVVRAVAKDSIAEQAGIRGGDVIIRIAGRPVTAMKDVTAAVQRQAPGTWLPLSVRRADSTVELVARFPAQP
ncbi:MAG: ChaN family lipoprotein [Burkholderiales bacterium]|nr:ChaN family lipoprotein [Burkholderiales bacterium]